MAFRSLLLVVGAAVAAVFASAVQPTQPPRLRADVLIIGFVPCNNGTAMKTGSSPAFPNAVVQLQCADGAVAANATTDGRGWFRMARNTTAALSSIAGECKLVVDTPLAACNPALPATGFLQSGLRRLVSMILLPRGFSYIVA